MLFKELYDTEYKAEGFTHTRNTVRAIVFNDKNEVAMLRIKGEDFFGKRNHYESPGGGIEGKEDPITALKRELLEEIGYHCEVDDYIGMIISRYNLIHRITVSRYYICHIVDKGSIKQTEEEKILIHSIVFKPLNYWLETLKEAENPVDRLVHERELTVLRYLDAISNRT